MPLPARDAAYLWDMWDSASSVVRFVGEKTFEDYVENLFIVEVRFGKVRKVFTWNFNAG